MIIISVAKKTGLATSMMRRTTEASSNDAASSSSRFFRIVSIITIEPSTNMPKSTAPSESRLAGISVRYIRMKATSSDRGMVTATSSAPRQLPRKIIRMATTSIIPKNRVWETVRKVVSTRFVLSMKGWIFTPSGRISLLSSSTALCTSANTCEGF
ncbi:hypothetical protein Barb7_02247 [Bacteroidales bacterium Barb7]|nr:hypothetical protein Barb7_02247 [Bacteroidales bacterium Barb7]